MLPTHLDLTELDEISCDFEDNWRPELTLEELRQIAEQRVQSETESFRSLLLEFSAVDLEKRWQDRSEVLSREYERQPDGPELDLPSLPDYRDYARLFGPAGEQPELLQSLAQAELKVRWAFGDIPDPASYDEFIAAQLYRPVGEEIPVIRLSSGGLVLATMEVIGKVMIGRQAYGEPAPYCVIDGQPRKLVCAGQRETTTSRNQLSVQAVARRLIRLENGSRNRHLCLQGTVNLAPGERRFCKLMSPLEIYLKDSKITLEFPSE